MKQLSIWFMTDMHTFIRIKGEKVRELKAEAKQIAKKYPYGMVCAPILICEGKTEERIGKSCHVDGNGKVNLREWGKSIKTYINLYDCEFKK